MGLLIKDNNGIYDDTIIPHTYDHAIEAYREANSLLAQDGETWREVWPELKHIYKDGQFVQGSYRWYKSDGANQNPSVGIINADGYLRINVTGTSYWGIVPIIVFSAPVPATAKSIVLKFKWGNNARPYDFSLRAFDSYLNNDINNCLAATSMTRENNTTDTLVCDISDVNTECYAEIDVWVGTGTNEIFPGCTGENMMLDILELYYE